MLVSVGITDQDKTNALLVCPNTDKGAAEASRNKASYE